MSFFKANPEAWAVASESIPTPWPDEVCELDIAYWANEQRRPGGKPVPARRKMQARWGRSDWYVRSMRKAHLEPTQRQPNANPTPTQPDTVEPTESVATQPNANPTPTHDPPSRDPYWEEGRRKKEDRHTSVVALVPPEPPPSDPVCEVFDELCTRMDSAGLLMAPLDVEVYRKALTSTLKAVQRQLASKRSRGLPTPDTAREGLYMVVDLWLTGPDSWKRDSWKGARFMSGLLKPTKVAERLEEAIGWDAEGRPTEAPQPERRMTAFEREAEESRRRIAARRRAEDGR